MRCLAEKTLRLKRQVSRARRPKSKDRQQRGGFPSAIASDQEDGFPGLDLQGNISQDVAAIDEDIDGVNMQDYAPHHIASTIVAETS